MHINPIPAYDDKNKLNYVPDASKARHIPFDDSMLNLWNCNELVGLSNRLTPPTTADSHCPLRMACNACDRANRLPEQAVSTA